MMFLVASYYILYELCTSHQLQNLVYIALFTPSMIITKSKVIDKRLGLKACKRLKYALLAIDQVYNLILYTQKNLYFFLSFLGHFLTVKEY